MAKSTRDTSVDKVEEQRDEQHEDAIIVSVVAISDNRAVVERVIGGAPERRIVPARAIAEDDKIPLTVWEAGIEYGLSWEQIVVLHATPETVAAELRRAGIWTLDDLYHKPQAALGALQAAYHLDLAALIQAASKVTTKGEEK